MFTHKFLTEEIDNWRDPLFKILNMNIEQIHLEDNDCLDKIIEILQGSVSILDSLGSKVTRLQSVLRTKRVFYLIHTQDLKGFAKKARPQPRYAPAAQTLIKDKDSGELRPCKDDNERVIATEDRHGFWMGNSKAKETCAFAEVISKGKLGLRGVKLKPDRKVKLKDVKRLIPKGKLLDKKMKSLFIIIIKRKIRRRKR